MEQMFGKQCCGLLSKGSRNKKRIWFWQSTNNLHRSQYGLLHTLPRDNGEKIPFRS